VALVVAATLGCNSQDTTQPTSAAPSGDPARSLGIAEMQAATVSADASSLPEFDPGHFVSEVDNPYFPLPLGRRLVYHGTEDGERETVITDVTRLKKTILGVPVVVVLDRVFLAGELKEKTFDWYAEDDHGNVWYFGEDTREFENGKVVTTAGSFEAGKDGARAGIIMRSHRTVGQVTPQEFAPGVAEDKARIVSMRATVTVPFGTFHNCIKTEEFTPLEPDVLENKWYCAGLGIVRERDAKGGSVSTALTNVVQR
jgi:hypothetical protein